MIKPEQVPDEVWTQVALRLESAGAVVSDQVAKLVAADALNAWPGMGAGGNCTRGTGACDCWNARAALEERT